MQSLLDIAREVATHLRARNETVAVAESSSGGLVAAALLAQPGASAFFLGGGVIYTARARTALLGITTDMDGMRPSTEPYALLLARTVRGRLGSTWGIAETGAAGPSANGYGDPPGHCCVAVSGSTDVARTLATPRDDRADTMRAFASGALTLLLERLRTA